MKLEGALSTGNSSKNNSGVGVAKQMVARPGIGKGDIRHSF